MCTAIAVTVLDSYFGRNLDYEHTFGEKIIITPRRFFRNSHYAIIGTGLPYGGYPLYFDGTNERGLSAAGLNFPESCVYEKDTADKINVPSYALISKILSECCDVSEAEEMLRDINITDKAFNDDLKPSPLHWIIADKQRTITVEQTEKGLMCYNNPVGILANEPPFNIQMTNLVRYMNVTADEAKNRFSDKVDLLPYSRGMGGIGLPGDLSSPSRFVRGAFVKLNSVFGTTEKEIVGQFFHILNSVAQQKGCARVGDGYEVTNYSSCCNASKGIYYYTTYYNSRIYGVDMHREDLNSNKLIVYEMMPQEEFRIQN